MENWTGGVMVLLLVMKAFEKLNWILDFVTIYSNKIARAQIVRAVDSSTLFQILLAYVSSVHQLASPSAIPSVYSSVHQNLWCKKNSGVFAFVKYFDGWVG